MVQNKKNKTGCSKTQSCSSASQTKDDFTPAYLQTHKKVRKMMTFHAYAKKLHPRSWIHSQRMLFLLCINMLKHCYNTDIKWAPTRRRKRKLHMTSLSCHIRQALNSPHSPGIFDLDENFKWTSADIKIVCLKNSLKSGFIMTRGNRWREEK